MKNMDVKEQMCRRPSSGVALCSGVLVVMCPLCIPVLHSPQLAGTQAPVAQWTWAFFFKDVRCKHSAQCPGSNLAGLWATLGPQGAYAIACLHFLTQPTKPPFRRPPLANTAEAVCRNMQCLIFADTFRRYGGFPGEMNQNTLIFLPGVGIKRGWHCWWVCVGCG